MICHHPKLIISPCDCRPAADAVGLVRHALLSEDRQELSSGCQKTNVAQLLTGGNTSTLELIDSVEQS